MNRYLQHPDYKRIPFDCRGTFTIKLTCNKFYFVRGWRNFYLIFRRWKLHFKPNLPVPEGFWLSLEIDWQTMTEYDPIPF